MIGFMTFIEKDGNFIAGYLGTNDELIPIEFIYTESIEPPSRLEEILHGKKFELRWYGDVIAGALFKGAQKSKNEEETPIRVIFVSHDKMLHLRRKTGEIPVLYITDKNEILVYDDYSEDLQLLKGILKEEISYTDIIEVFDRITKGIEESISINEKATTEQ